MLTKKAPYAFIGIVLMALVISSDFAHKGTASAEQAITQLAAIEKGVRYFDELIAKGRLDHNWRSQIASISISLRNIKGFTEYVVAFNAKASGIAPVNLFISMDGQYTGSNLD